ncbi:universal stress protein [Roseovarius spongiae]|uniref:Universal stress protein n=1 Tax=Roseovarius spongiae TaxID=2320272 RepID=A0A3A8B3I7_9RHOB|nr:universal stress protein [Roseovarius spongiae]RKF15392.1 universal stress protein [Roseovarius spongiae]
MTYRTVATVLTHTDLVAPVLDSAETFARANDAHLEVLAMGVDPSSAGFYYAGASAMVVEQSIVRAQETAAAVAAEVRKRLEQSELRWSCDEEMAQLSDLPRRVADRIRFSDLAILPKPYGEGRGAELEAVVETCLFEGSVPALILPEDAAYEDAPKRVVVAWNEATEALNAVRAALPLLRGADKVHVVVIDPPSHGPNRSDPGGMLSQFLARHDVYVEIDVLSKTLPRVADVLIRHATDMDAEMIVMGAYGRSRFREAVFGGTTRNMLENAVLPVLMAH